VGTHLLEVLATRVTQRLADLRRVLEGGAESGVLHVEYLERARLALVTCVVVEQV